MDEVTFTEKDWQNFAIKRKLKTNFQELQSITDKWGVIRQIYMERIPTILEVSKKNVRNGISPYFIDWAMFFSPIEEVAWHSIRSTGGIVMYPQFPLFNYFIDFANPFLRIGLELDGKEFHDSIKDKERDQILADYGWKIFRVSGKECFTDYKLPIELEQEEIIDKDDIDQELNNWFLNSCNGVIYALKEVYFTNPENRNPEYFNLALQTLYKHRLAEFEI